MESDRFMLITVNTHGQVFECRFPTLELAEEAKCLALFHMSIAEYGAECEKLRNRWEQWKRENPNNEGGRMELSRRISFLNEDYRRDPMRLSSSDERLITVRVARVYELS